MSSDITDTQTKNISQGINLILCYYPEAKLVVDYDKEIVMILPKDIGVLEDHLSVSLKRMGWENLEYYPYMWQYKVEGDVAEYYEKKPDTRPLIVERNAKGKLLREGLLNDDMTVEWKKQFT